jgi:hypothetical protein
MVQALADDYYFYRFQVGHSPGVVVSWYRYCVRRLPLTGGYNRVRAYTARNTYVTKILIFCLG